MPAKQKYPQLWAKLIKLDRLQDYKTLTQRMNSGMSMQMAIDKPIMGRRIRLRPIKAELFIPLRYRQNQNLIKVKYYDTEQDIERQILFDKRQLTYSLDELSEQEKQLLN